MYEGRTSFELGRTFGHENMGEVVEIGKGVEKVKVGDRVGTHWFKGQTMGNGQCPVKKYNRRLRDLIAADKAKPSWIVSHEISLEQAADAYKNFDSRAKGWTKVVIKPGMSNGKKAN
ncbi:alcohol dehydrogenase catalytic domain-containing protein [Blastococcus sp. Marseille-P5729]|uniref:alcohol dehydrogenase catalytic domain-containing protein n=1 Tax=Blastococcus sp. Marseille-P5729 TaxID=2086582 RepID=UPI002100DE1E|nr:alcohol dehydrogenase catalytic domain-containing protein [Blastococcus sp. Marseille-P5729]